MCHSGIYWIRVPGGDQDRGGWKTAVTSLLGSHAHHMCRWPHSRSPQGEKIVWLAPKSAPGLSGWSIVSTWLHLLFLNFLLCLFYPCYSLKAHTAVSGPRWFILDAPSLVQDCCWTRRLKKWGDAQDPRFLGRRRELTLGHSPTVKVCLQTNETPCLKGGGWCFWG